jgi:hypothetical protein
VSVRGAVIFTNVASSVFGQADTRTLLSTSISASITEKVPSAKNITVLVTSILDLSTSADIYTRVDNSRRLQGGSSTTGVKVEFLAQLPASSSSFQSAISAAIADSSFGALVSTKTKTLASTNSALSTAFSGASATTSTVSVPVETGGSASGSSGGGGGAAGGIIGALIVIAGGIFVAHYLGYTKNIPILKNLPPITIPSFSLLKKQNVLSSTPSKEEEATTISENAVDVVVSPLQSVVTHTQDTKIKEPEATPVNKTPGIVVRNNVKPEETESATSSNKMVGKAPPKKKAMSDLQASTIIQSRYKSFKVRSTLKGWTKVVDDDGDVYFRNDLTGDTEWNLPTIPFHPVKEEGEEKKEGYTEVDEDGVEWNLDGPGGPRLQQGWHREEDESDVWYVHENGESAWDAPLA